MYLIPPEKKNKPNHHNVDTGIKVYNSLAYFLLRHSPQLNQISHMIHQLLPDVKAMTSKLLLHLRNFIYINDPVQRFPSKQCGLKF